MANGKQCPVTLLCIALLGHFKFNVRLYFKSLWFFPDTQENLVSMADSDNETTKYLNHVTPELLHCCYRPQTKFTKVMFSQVSVCPRGGGCLPHCMLGYTPGQTPPADTPQADTPPCADTPLGSACWDTVNKRAVCIPLECILVEVNFISLKYQLFGLSNLQTLRLIKYFIFGVMLKYTEISKLILCYRTKKSTRSIVAQKLIYPISLNI